MEIAENLGGNDEVVRVRRLSPPTAENRSLVAFELHSDKQTRKPGILIIGGKYKASSNSIEDHPK